MSWYISHLQLDFRVCFFTCFYMQRNFWRRLTKPSRSDAKLGGDGEVSQVSLVRSRPLTGSDTHRPGKIWNVHIKHWFFAREQLSMAGRRLKKYEYADPDVGELPGPHSIAAMRLLCMAQVTWACFFCETNVWITSLTFIVWGLKSTWPSNSDSWMTVYCFQQLDRGNRAISAFALNEFAKVLAAESLRQMDGMWWRLSAKNCPWRSYTWQTLTDMSWILALHFKCWFRSEDKDCNTQVLKEVLKSKSVFWFGDLVCQTRAKPLKS